MAFPHGLGRPEPNKIAAGRFTISRLFSDRRRSGVKKMNTQRAMNPEQAPTASTSHPVLSEVTADSDKSMDMSEHEKSLVASDVDDDDDDDDVEVDMFAAAAAADPSGDSTKLFREDPILDRRIIEGMLQDRNTFLEEMASEGFGAAAVLRRAAELGLSEALIRQVKGVAADLAGERPGRRPAPSSLGARTCLSCDRVFLSSGPGNRLCMRCRGGDAGLAQL